VSAITSAMFRMNPGYAVSATYGLDVTSAHSDIRRPTSQKYMSTSLMTGYLSPFS